MTFDRLAYQREYRKANGNTHTKVYEKTISGFLMRMYRNMKSRITGVQTKKAHLYVGKELLPKEDFYAWAKDNPNFLALWEDYVKANHEQRLAPTVDRLDSSIGYTLSNMEWVTHSENSKRGSIARHTKNLCHS